MALPAAGVWEVRTAGNAANGGGFLAGGTGTDYSQQDAPLIAFTDLTVDATTNTKVTSAQVGFTAAHVGNIIKITGGAGFTVGWYQVVSVAAGAATLDRSPAAVTTAGGTGNIGGALDGPTTLATAMVASNKAFIKSGTYTTGSLITFAQASVTPANNVPYTRIIGYNATRGDITPWTANQANRPQILNSTLNASVISLSNGGWLVENLICGPSVVATIGTGIIGASAGQIIVNCKAFNFSTAGFSSASSGNGEFFRCEVTGGTAGIGINCSTGFNVVADCWSHDHTGSTVGLSTAASGMFLRNIISNLAGANADGIALTAGAFALNNTIYNCARDGIRVTDTAMKVALIRGNLIAECGGFGLSATVAAMLASPLWDGNAFYVTGGSGTRNNFDDVATNAINGVSPYANSRDVILSADPFVAKGSNNFALNSAVGGGAACRGTAGPPSWPGLALAGSLDFGAVQSSGSGGGGGRAGVAIVGGSIFV